jgi:hypothetical protein
MKVRSILVVILLMMYMLSTGCMYGYDDLTGGGQCPEGTSPVIVVNLDGTETVECLP